MRLSSCKTQPLTRTLAVAELLNKAKGEGLVTAKTIELCSNGHHIHTDDHLVSIRAALFH